MAGNGSLSEEETMRMFKQQLLNFKSTSAAGGGMEGAAESADWWWGSRLFGVLYITIGVLSILLNSLILFSLVRRRKQLTSCYYLLLFNFALLDSLKGLCSILYAVKSLEGSMKDHWGTVLDQYSGLGLRFANIVTIINLMMITLNEFIYISNPLRYSILVTKVRVVIVILLSWFLSALFVLGTSLLQARSGDGGIMFDSECLTRVEKQKTGNLSECVEPNTKPNTDSGISHQIFYISVVLFCIVGLLVTYCTYFFLIKIISKLVNDDAKLKSELDALVANNGNNTLLDHDENAEKKKRRSSHGTAIRRKKFAIVIGSVIVVYSIFLLNYAISQILQVIHLNMSGEVSLKVLKAVCYLFISLHSLLQPLCYFRVKEFRDSVIRSLCGRRQRTGAQFDTMTTSVARRADV